MQWIKSFIAEILNFYYPLTILTEVSHKEPC
jgi:hypothetical protein